MHSRRGVVALATVVLLSFAPSARAVGQEFRLGDYIRRVPQGEMVITFGDSAAMKVGFNGSVFVEGTFTVTGDTMTIINYGGPAACPPDEVGRYRWALRGDTLSLAPISDPCSGRVAGLMFTTWTAKQH